MLKIVQDLCKQNNVRLLYLTKFGSHLYGTDTKDSDLDLKGIFLPLKEQCFLGNMPKNLNFSTGLPSSRNTKSDVDIQLWSLQYFFKLVSKGETNALDLLYSGTNTSMVLYNSEVIENVFRYHDKLYNLKDCNAFVGYALGQAKKYGIKGSRLGKLREVYDYVKNFNIDNGEKLESLIYIIIDKFYDESYCFTKTVNGVFSLVLCGKVHNVTITIEEFKNRLKITLDKYGERAELARQNKGIDWKALSHAVRALYQMKELINYGKIQYPLSNAWFLLKIKSGECSFGIVEALINYLINDIKNKLKNIDSKKIDCKLIENIILKCYEIGK